MPFFTRSFRIDLPVVLEPNTHQGKQEDIICRVGTLAIQLFPGDDQGRCQQHGHVRLLRNGKEVEYPAGTTLYLQQGERVTLRPGMYHEFWPVAPYAIIGEVSTYNDDASDNFFVNPDVGRYEEIEEDVPAMYRLVSDD